MEYFILNCLINIEGFYFKYLSKMNVYRKVIFCGFRGNLI